MAGMAGRDGTGRASQNSTAGRFWWDGFHTVLRREGLGGFGGFYGIHFKQFNVATVLAGQDSHIPTAGRLWRDIFHMILRRDSFAGTDVADFYGGTSLAVYILVFNHSHAFFPP